MAAPTPRKSNRVLISLAAWFSALSTSWRSILLTMSKNDSAMSGSLLCVFPAPPMATSRGYWAAAVRTRSRLRALPLPRSAPRFAILH